MKGRALESSGRFARTERYVYPTGRPKRATISHRPLPGRKGGRVALGVEKACEISPELRNASRPQKNAIRTKFPVIARGAGNDRNLESLRSYTSCDWPRRTRLGTVGPGQFG